LEASRFDLTEQEFRSQHLFGIRVPGEYDLESLKDRLADGGVSVSLRGGAIRVSPYVYNDRDDVEALRIALQL
jgi:selenocysteine lyase/cysteine desulfurase